MILGREAESSCEIDLTTVKKKLEFMKEKKKEKKQRNLDLFEPIDSFLTN